MATEAFRLDVLAVHDIERAARFFNYKPDGADDIALRKNMTSGDWNVVMAVKGDSDIGAFYLNWKPKYAIYQRLNIPELQDLRVLPGHRRQGAATAMIAKAEDMAKAAGRTGIGLSVGLSADYGAAQRLYARLAYIPDGNGVTYDRQPVEKGEKRPIDDDLALMLVKFF